MIQFPASAAPPPTPLPARDPPPPAQAQVLAAPPLAATHRPDAIRQGEAPSRSAEALFHAMMAGRDDRAGPAGPSPAFQVSLLDDLRRSQREAGRAPADPSADDAPHDRAEAPRSGSDARSPEPLPRPPGATPGAASVTSVAPAPFTATAAPGPISADSGPRNHAGTAATASVSAPGEQAVPWGESADAPRGSGAADASPDASGGDEIDRTRAPMASASVAATASQVVDLDRTV